MIGKSIMNSIVRLPFVLLFTALFFPLLLQASDRPRLVVVISVDQMRADYFERFEKNFSGGFRRLYDEGIKYVNTDLNYSNSATGPGHASLSTGTYPRVSGIANNDWVERSTRKGMYCVFDSLERVVEDSGVVASPRNLKVTGLADWIKQNIKGSKAISLSIKDRVGVLLGGKKPDYGFWYERTTGRFITSTYYTASLPKWMKDFNASGWYEKNVPSKWEKLLPESEYALLGPDEQQGEYQWDGKTTFPHTFDPAQMIARILITPWGDLLVLDATKAAILGEQLGMRGTTDYVGIGLSCTDYVGHAFGPDSHEMFDHLVRVDRKLGEFFAFLDETIGKEHYMVALSADHGVMPLPEVLAQKGLKARRVPYNTEINPGFMLANQQLMRRLSINTNTIEQRSFLRYDLAVAQGIDSVQFENMVEEELRKIDAVEDVLFRRELEGSAPSANTLIEKFRNAYFSERAGDFVVQYKENHLLTSGKTGTSHGTVWGYDTRIPLVFWRHGVAPAFITDRSAVVDMAPTIAAILGIKTPPTVLGTPLPYALQHMKR